MRRGVVRLRHVRRLLVPLSRRDLPPAGGKYIAPHCEHLDARVQEVKDGKFEALIESLMEKPLDAIKELYNHREIEK